MHVGARRSIVRVPFFVLDYEGRCDVLHRGMILVLDRDRASDKCSDVILEADASHELLKPGPDLIAIEFAQQSGMMKSDPAAFALFYVFDEGGFGSVRPHVGRVIQLN